jgi:outer membrane protein TolC
MDPFKPTRPRIRSLAAALALGVMCWALPATAHADRELTLAQALDLAKQHNPVLKASQRDVQAADAQRTIAGSAYLPKLEASETFTNTNNPSQVFGILLNQGRFTQAQFDITSLNRPSSVENYRSAVTLVQPVYNGGRESLGIAMAEIGQTAMQEGLEHARQRVLFTVTRAYYELALSKAIHKVARESVQIAEADLKQIQSRFQGGAVVKSDVLQAQVRLAALREEAIRADQGVRVAAIALRHAIGLDESVDAAELLAVGAEGARDLAATVAQAMEARPDYRMLAAERRKAEMGTRLAKAAYLPNINFQTGYELNNTAPFSPNGSNNYVALGVMSFNLFNGLADAAQVRKARAQEEKARELLDAKRREIEVEVVDAHYGLTAARERLAVSDSAVAQAEESLRIARNRYNAGLAPVSDLLTAELSLNQAKQNRMKAMYDERIGLARLQLAAGQFQKGAD